MAAYEQRRRVGFKDTNLTGNVYFLSHFAWQGECRESFLQEHFPEILEELQKGFCLITTYSNCEYLAELNAFDDVIVRMRLGSLSQTQITMLFEYWKSAHGTEEIVARGEQRIACFQRSAQGLLPVNVPSKLKAAISQYSDVLG
ncbi:MAG TPA: acyl-CoA thioesterase [Candidatus Angelobacter sp.]